MIIVVCYMLQVLVVSLLRSGYVVMFCLVVLCLLVNWFALLVDCVVWVRLDCFGVFLCFGLVLIVLICACVECCNVVL